MANGGGTSPGLISVMLGVWQGRRGAQRVALAGPGVLLTASLVHLALSAAILVSALAPGLPVFEDTGYLIYLPLLPVLLLLSYWGSSNTAILTFMRDQPFGRLIFLSSGGCWISSLLLALMGLVVHLPLGQEAGAWVNGILLVLGIVWTAFYLYTSWVHLLKAPRWWAGILCLPVAAAALPATVYVWLVIYGMDKLSWDPYFYL